MRRIALIAIAAALFVGMLPAVAFGWANGPNRNGQRGGGYGTHDWILDRAIKLAGADGAWVVRSTALLATDDPDYGRTPVYYHWYSFGTARAAPWVVGEHYHKAVAALAAGDRAAASRYLGQLSHYFADVTQPFHTSSAASAHYAIHDRYEKAVDPIQNSGSSVPSWVTPRARVAVTDVRAKTVSAAVYARSYYSRLYASYKASNSVRTGVTNKITKLMMNRAVNDLADIIVGIRAGSGEAVAPATIDMRLSRTNPRPFNHVKAYVTCLGADGAPLNAVQVRFIWKLPTGTQSWPAYTDTEGNAVSLFMDIGASPVGQARPVTAEITVNGVIVTRTCTFTPVR